MHRKSFYLTAVLSASMIAGCSSGPTVINSTWHKHEGEKPVSNVLTSKGSTTYNGTSEGSAGHENANYSEMNRSGMNRSETGHAEMKSAPEAANQPFDLQFLDTMIAHHEGAIEMAKTATGKSTDAELKTFAVKIIADRTREITTLKKWREQWFAGKPSALNMEMAGMHDSMKGMDAGRMSAANGKEFDLEFVNQMTPHHEGATVMAQAALTKAEHAEIKTLARQIITSQEAEIKQMQIWKTK